MEIAIRVIFDFIVKLTPFFSQQLYFACTVEMTDDDPRFQPFKENIEFDKDLKQYEKITVPSIDEFEEATVLHDFERVGDQILWAHNEKRSFRCFSDTENIQEKRKTEV